MNNLLPKRLLANAGLLLLAGIALTACAAPPGASSLPDTSLPGSLTGSVIYRERIALDPNAVIEVQLLDVSKADAPAEVIASQTLEAEGRQVPIPFELTYDPAQIDERFSYTVSARILVNDRLRWISQDAYPVLTQGSPVSDVEIVVKMVPSSGAAGLTDQEWTLNTMVVDGEQATLEEGVATTIRFLENGTFAGSGGCNRYTGSYTVDGNTITMQMPAATLMACETGSAQEAKFFTALPKISTNEVTAERLRLSSLDGETELIFAAGAGG
jgi:putative lipoprotein